MHSYGFEWTLILITFVAAGAYLFGALRQLAQGKPWHFARTAGFVFGAACIAVGLSPTVTAYAHQAVTGHMLQHLLIGMFAPLGLVLSAPMTLLLRSIPKPGARGVVRLLRSPFIAGISHPVTALLLNVGGMYLLYLTPLYAAAVHNPVIHMWMHLHFIVAGCLFTWAIAGPDPGPERPSARYRFWVLFASMATHGILAKAMYAYGWPRGTGAAAAELEAAAKLMYYGGDLAEVLLLIALLVPLYYRGKQHNPTQMRVAARNCR